MYEEAVDNIEEILRRDAGNTGRNRRPGHDRDGDSRMARERTFLTLQLRRALRSAGPVQQNPHLELWNFHKLLNLIIHYAHRLDAGA